jgi:hypothetical protein
MNNPEQGVDGDAEEAVCSVLELSVFSGILVFV